MEKKKVVQTSKIKWFYSKSRVSGEVKKPKGFEAWFYTGGTMHFGHYPPAKKSRG